MTSKLTCAILSTMLVAAAASAQEKAQRPKKTPTPLKLQIVYTRYQGEKKVGSVPYTLSVNADDRPAMLRMGIQVPILVQVKDAVGPQVSYRDVGNNLDCNAEALEDGRFKVMCSFEQSSVYSTDADRRVSGSAIGEVALGNNPVIRNFRSATSLILRDGQTTQYTAATDPVSGEVLKIDVTLNVVK